MQKTIKTIIALICMLQLVACSSTQSKQIEGTWERTESIYDDGVTTTVTARITFNRQESSGGTFVMLIGMQASVVEMAAQVEGDWNISFGTLNFYPDMSTLKTDKNIFAIDVDVESLVRSAFSGSDNEEGSTIIELNDRILKLYDDGGFITFHRVTQKQTTYTEPTEQFDDTEEADEQYVCEDNYERLWRVASERALTYSDIANLPKKERRILRNYFYARFFYRFKSKDLKSFFSQYSWYKPLYDDASIVEHSLTTIQQKNIKFIKDNE